MVARNVKLSISMILRKKEDCEQCNFAPMKRALNYQFFNVEKKGDKRKKQMFKLLVKPMYSNSDTKQFL